MVILHVVLFMYVEFLRMQQFFFALHFGSHMYVFYQSDSDARLYQDRREVYAS
jgi:hypothetical protein